VVYSSDTGPSERLIRFASQADLLFHECAGLSQHPIPDIHSNALEVGDVGKRSAVKTLVLLHFTTVLDDAPEELVAEVRQNFAGEIHLASDFDEYIISDA
jgi:ribonuclease BN (tRNA processing enzyme)